LKKTEFVSMKRENMPSSKLGQERFHESRFKILKRNHNENLARKLGPQVLVWDNNASKTADSQTFGLINFEVPVEPNAHHRHT